ncbi:MAG: SUMF1/EgtB/PvdO family nonheme iron enzyme [Deltaproteobacteria bacterium]
MHLRDLALGLTLACAMAACGGPSPSDDGSVDGFADSARDALVSLDALDAAFAADAIDAMDTSDAVDANPPDAMPDGSTACTVNGTPGECIDVAGCLAPSVATPGHCPGAANIQCCTPGTMPGWCPATMATPNAGLGEEPGVGGCPAGMLRVDTFCIDRFEASLEEVHADGTRASWSPYYNPGTRRMRAVSLRGAVPQGYIDGDQSGAACAEAGKRLCTDTEWLRVCRSAAGYTYPYGNARVPGVCNDARATHPAIQCFGTSAAWIWSEIGYAGINQQADTVALTGAHAGCVTTEGAFDMMGNVHEWTADPAGTFRGGYYVDTVINGNGCLYATTAHNTLHWDYSTGFRCCAD